MSSRKILSVGGSIIIPKTGFDPAFLRSFRKLVLERIGKGDRFILTIGGGATCRAYQEAARQVNSKLTDTDIDWIGIHSTIFNAQFVRHLFKDVAAPTIITNPKKRIAATKPLIIAAGHVPGHSTDTDAVHLAKTYGVSEIFNLSNISHVYDKDPNIFSDAKPIHMIDWAQFRETVVGNEWTPGKSAPFDPIASRHAQKQRLTVHILAGTDLPQVRRALSGKRFVGTTVHP